MEPRQAHSNTHGGGSLQVLPLRGRIQDDARTKVPWAEPTHWWDALQVPVRTLRESLPLSSAFESPWTEGAHEGEKSRLLPAWLREGFHHEEVSRRTRAESHRGETYHLCLLWAGLPEPHKTDGAPSEAWENDQEDEGWWKSTNQLMNQWLDRAKHVNVNLPKIQTLLIKL